MNSSMMSVILVTKALTALASMTSDGPRNGMPWVVRKSMPQPRAAKMM
jgi:hypothetical protein